MDDPELRPDLEEQDAAAPERSRSLVALLSTPVGILLGGVATFYVARRLVHDWPDAKSALQDAELWWIAGGALLAAAGMTSMGAGWHAVLAMLGVRAPMGRVVAWYYVGELGKYLPGGVWPVLGRGELARRGGVPRGRSYASVGLSLALLYLAAMFVATGFLPFAVSGGGFNPWMLFLLALPVGVVALHHEVLGWGLGVLSRVTGKDLAFEIPLWGDSLRLVARYVPTWAFVGSATWAIARALDPGASFSKVMFATVLSWVAGFLAVPVPAGAGVREAVLAASSGLDGGVAAATAIIARVLFVLVDVLGAAVCAPAAGRRRGGASVGPIRTEERAST
ncbi:MAG: flippase-like domain-containing protein [Acidimicrobiales bacterium]|nr:flippase-like domain-containing protein [Acidimicrobiales bacterium]